MTAHSDDTEAKRTFTVDELLLHAHAIEADAQERYLSLADQMAVHGNGEAETLFRKLAGIEGRHADELQSLLKDRDIPRHAPWEFSWITRESPESADLNDIHYMMGPHQILEVALRGERRALKFFEYIVSIAQTDDVRRLASEMAEEERQHVGMVEELLRKSPPAAPDWDEDPDPPAAVD